METQADKRTVSPDAEAIKRLRLGKGWRTEDLAKNAKCSIKTVENVERGAKVYLFTLAKFAKALGVEFATLVQGDKLPPDSPPSNPSIEVKIVLSIPYNQFDESEQLGSFVGLLKQLLGGGGDIDVLRVASGSTVITLLMSVQDMIELHSAYSQGKLKGLLCEDLQLEYDDYLRLDESTKKQLAVYLLEINKDFASSKPPQSKRDEKSRKLPNPEPQTEQ